MTVRLVPTSLVVALAATVLSTLAVPAHAETSAQVKQRLTAVVRRLDQAEAAEAVATDRLTKLERRLSSTQQAIDAVQSRLAHRARAVYMSGIGVEPIAMLVTSADPGAAIERVTLLNAATREDREAMRRAAVLRRTLRMQRAQADDVRKEVTATRRRLAKDRGELTKLFALLAKREKEAAERAAAIAAARRALALRQARDRASRLRAARAAAEAARRRTSSRSLSVNGRFACLVGPAHAYSDTWGAPRSGGRTHKGVDVFAPYGSPAYAVTDGVITRTGSGGLGGITLYLRGDNGDVYYYAHNARNHVRQGQRVKVGEHIADVGDTGNARGTSPHVHFEVHPGGGSPVNPYPFVKRTCG